MLPKEDARKELAKLIDKFQKEAENGSIDSYQETEIRTNFIDKFFEILGWEVYNHDEVMREFSTHKQKRADYVFKLNNRKVFVVEAKKAGVKLDNDEGEKAFKQAISYAYFNKIKFAVVANFRQIFVFHALSNPKTPKSNLLFVKGIGYFGLKFSEFLDNFDSLWLLSRESFLKNEMEKMLKEKDIKTSKPIDEAILGDLVEIRKLLSSDIKTHNQDLLNKYKDETNLMEEAVQRLINRLIFIRYTEDRGLEDENLLLNRLKNYQDMTSDKRLYAEIRDIFLQFNGKYNSKLFSLHEIDKEIRISEKVMENVIRILYTGIDRNQENYNFAHIGVDLLGSIYEQYLGMLLHSTEKRARLEDAKSKRKKMGIYYTPEYIVDYIVKSTIGEAAKGKSIDEILEMKILDPACGSGSFLIKAFDEVCSAVERGLKAGEKSKKFKSFQSFEGRLNLAQKIAILKNTIHGVDLDEKAVEIAQLSLLLKLLENEESHANKMLLPTMTDNIQHGNSLIDDTSVAGDNAFNWQSRFREVFAGGGFDVVVGNPPYIRNRELKENEKKFFENKYQSAEGQYDIYQLFFEESIKNIKSGALLGFITSNKYAITDYGKKLRKFILDNCAIMKIADVSNISVFKEASTYPYILILKKEPEEKSRNNNEIEIVKAGDEEDLQKLKPQKLKQRTFLENDGFVFSLTENKYTSILEKINKNTIKLGEISVIREAIHTGNIREKVISDKKINEKYKPLIGGREIDRYSIYWDGRYILYDPSVIDKNKKEYGNFPDKIFFENDKLILRDISKSMTATFDNEKFYCLNTLYSLLLNNQKYLLKYILAIINSKLIQFFFSSSFASSHVRGGYLRFKPMFTKQIPIHIASQKEQQPLIALVDRMLSLNKRLREPNVSSSERERIEKQIEDADFEIDEAVYRLYGITEEEKKVIEGAMK